MDPLTQLRLTRDLIDIDSTTGHEGAVATTLAGWLRDAGLHVLEQTVSGDRRNVYATTGVRPDVVFSTHIDCVPPFFPSRQEGGRIYGRGACDAKGIAVAQMAALSRLRALGETRVGLLFVVGEERGSEGAIAAAALAPGSRFLVNGEPTDNKLGLATRGTYRVRLLARGRAAHSCFPHLGESAIEKLVDALTALRSVAWPCDPLLGATHYTVGLIDGGVAPNVVPPHASAELMFRTVGTHHDVRRVLEQAVGPGMDIDDVAVVPPVQLMTRSGFDTAVLAFTTDIPFLSAWGSPLLLGPGSITVAHTSDEHVDVPELHRGVDLYVDLARQLLAD